MNRLLLVVPLLAGCLDRDEEIVVRPDGSAEVTLTYKGGPGDFDEWLDFPSSGWDVSKSKDVWKAKRTFRDLNELPASFAAEDLPHRGRRFRCETRLRISNSGGQRVYEFERTWPRFDAQDLRRLDDGFLTDPEIVDILKKGLEKLGTVDRTRLYGRVAEIEREKQMILVARALRAARLDWERQLPILANVQKALREAIVADTIGNWIAKPEETRREIRRRVVACLPSLESHYDAEVTAYHSANALWDDTIRGRVKLPGRVIAGSPSWEFPARELFERSITVRVVAVEP